MRFLGFLQSIFLLSSLLVSVPALSAGLPQAVDGEELPSLAPMLEKVSPAVVNISTEGEVRLQQNPLMADPFFRRFFGEQPQTRKTQSLGSGVIYDSKEGLVLTNYHVIANAVKIVVTLYDGRKLQAELIGADPDTDIALLKMPAEDLTAVKVAKSKLLRVGDFVVAIGNPFSLSHTVTSGIVSALSRSGLGISKNGYEDFIQTDAAINPGNSGGALVNLRGELVGINTAIFSRSGGSNGIGFAIPSDLALNVATQIREHGKVTRGFLGVEMQDLSPDLAIAFGLEGYQKGALVVKVVPDSPADQAGITMGDIIVSVDGQVVENVIAARSRVGIKQMGQEIAVEVIRKGKRKKLKARISDRKLSQANKSKPNLINELLKGVSIADFGVDHPAYGKVGGGAVVVNVPKGSPAWRGNLRAEDIITSVNGIVVSNLREFLEQVDGREDALVFRVLRGERAAFIVIK